MDFLSLNIDVLIFIIFLLILFKKLKNNKKIAYFRNGITSVVTQKSLIKICGKTYDFESTYLQGIYFVKVENNFINLTRDNNLKYISDIRNSALELYFTPLKSRF